MAASNRRRAPRVLLALALGLALVAFTGEIGARVWIARNGLRATADSWRAFASGSKTPLMQPHPYLQFVRNPAHSSEVNSLGFYGPEWRRERAPGTLRIACLGASTTESGNAEGYAGSYPRKLELELARRTGRAIEVMDLGISGWTSAEILACWQFVARDFAPDLVVLHEAINDADPRNYPGFRGDYAHYRKSWEWPRAPLADRLLLGWSDAWLLLRFRKQGPALTHVSVREPSGPLTFRDGHFPPGTEQPFRRNMDAVLAGARHDGAAVLVATLPSDPRLEASDDEASRAHRAALREHNQILRELALANGAWLCDLESEAAADPALFAGQFLDVVHLSPAGNEAKAHAIAEQLLRDWPALRAPADATPPR